MGGNSHRGSEVRGPRAAGSLQFAQRLVRPEERRREEKRKRKGRENQEKRKEEEKREEKEKSCVSIKKSGLKNFQKIKIELKTKSAEVRERG